MAILATGAAGAIGSVVVDLLRARLLTGRLALRAFTPAALARYHSRP